LVRQLADELAGTPANCTGGQSGEYPRHPPVWLFDEVRAVRRCDLNYRFLTLVDRAGTIRQNLVKE